MFNEVVKNLIVDMPYNLPNSEQEWSEVIQKNKSYIEELKSQSKNIQKATLDEH